MPSNPWENADTTQLVETIKDPNNMGWQDAVDELEYRIIKQDDDDDTPEHRGGVRPKHRPILP